MKRKRHRSLAKEDDGAGRKEGSVIIQPPVSDLLPEKEVGPRAIWRLPQVQTPRRPSFSDITHAAIARWPMLTTLEGTPREPVIRSAPDEKCPDGEITDDEDAAESQALVALGIVSGSPSQAGVR
jgi:hypothetical protein